MIIVAGLILVGFFGLVIWQLMSLWLFVVPSPLETLRAIDFVRNQGNFGPAAAATFVNAVVSFIAAVVGGAALGVALGRSDYWYRVFEPLIIVGGAIPKIIIYPTLLLLVGLGARSIISMGFIGGIFAVLINVMVAIRTKNPIYGRVARSLAIGPWRAAWRIYLPAVSLPFITGVRLSFGLVVVNVIFGELFAAKAGIGKLALHFYGQAQYAAMMVVIMILFLFGTTGSLLLWAVERRLKKYF
jgi:NitT/TauT family transport system permease protein